MVRLRAAPGAGARWAEGACPAAGGAARPGVRERGQERGHLTSSSCCLPSWEPPRPSGIPSALQTLLGMNCPVKAGLADS